MALLGLTNTAENKKFTLWVAFTKSVFPARPSRVCSCSSGPHSRPLLPVSPPFGSS